ncbi:MAG: sirohydrochlorin chelatase [Pirellulales bacterium]
MQASLDQPPFRPGMGLLLVGHGTRDATGTTEFLEAVRLVAERVHGLPVEPCFLEFAAPSIAEGFARLAAAGVKHVVVAPVILFAAGHIRRDIPREVAQAAARFPGVTFEQAEHLGCHPALVAQSRRRFDEALAASEDHSPLHNEMPAPATALLLVGRGSRDADATAEMHTLAQLRQAAAPLVKVRVAFMAMADPPLEPMLDELVAAGLRRVIIQPHLLFAGELLARLGAIVNRYRDRYPKTQWLIAAHLGPAEGVVDAILDRAAAAAGTTAQ